MTKARDIMHVGVECIGERETLDNAARRMRELDVGALPICGDDDRLKGIITDRDIVLKCVAAGRNPAELTAGELAQGTPFTIDAESDVDDVLHMMEDHRVRRLPVLDNHRVVGMISEADLGRNLPEERVGHFVETICATAS
jgi:CBS domain-containing protein